MAVCRVVKGLKGARIGAIGARTTPFKTVRYSEKLLEASGISVETLDLFEILTAVDKLKDNDPQVQFKLKIISGYCIIQDISFKSLLRMAKMGTVLDRWVKENEIDACTIQCWSALQDALQIFPCALMSIMSEALIPAACEVDVMGAVAMYALQLASGKPAGRIDKLQEPLRFLCRNGFEHHVAINQSKSAGVLFEALDNYVGWDVYLHQG